MAVEGVVVGLQADQLVDGNAVSCPIAAMLEIGTLVDLPFAQVAALVSHRRNGPGFRRQAVRPFQADGAEQAMVLGLPESVHPVHVLQDLTPLLGPRRRRGIQRVAEAARDSSCRQTCRP